MRSRIYALKLIIIVVVTAASLPSVSYSSIGCDLLFSDSQSRGVEEEYSRITKEYEKIVAAIAESKATTYLSGKIWSLKSNVNIRAKWRGSLSSASMKIRSQFVKYLKRLISYNHYRSEHAVSRMIEGIFWKVEEATVLIRKELKTLAGLKKIIAKAEVAGKSTNEMEEKLQESLETIKSHAEILGKNFEDYQLLRVYALERWKNDAEETEDFRRRTEYVYNSLGVITPQRAAYPALKRLSKRPDMKEIEGYFYGLDGLPQLAAARSNLWKERIAIVAEILYRVAVDKTVYLVYEKFLKHLDRTVYTRWLLTPISGVVKSIRDHIYYSRHKDKIDILHEMGVTPVQKVFKVREWVAEEGNDMLLYNLARSIRDRDLWNEIYDAAKNMKHEEYFLSKLDEAFKEKDRWGDVAENPSAIGDIVKLGISSATMLTVALYYSLPESSATWQFMDSIVTHFAQNGALHQAGTVAEKVGSAIGQ